MILCGKRQGEINNKREREREIKKKPKQNARATDEAHPATHTYAIFLGNRVTVHFDVFFVRHNFKCTYAHIDARPAMIAARRN